MDWLAKIDYIFLLSTNVWPGCVNEELVPVVLHGVVQQHHFQSDVGWQQVLVG